MDSAGPPSRQRVSVDEAARVLGLSVDAIRKRVQRGTIEYEKDQAGRVRIILDRPDATSTLQDRSPDTTGQGARTELVEALREQVAYLQGVIATRDQELAVRSEEIRRRDAALEREQQLTAIFADQLRALEPARPSEARESPVSEASPGPSERVPPRPRKRLTRPHRARRGRDRRRAPSTRRVPFGIGRGTCRSGARGGGGCSADRKGSRVIQR